MPDEIYTIVVITPIDNVFDKESVEEAYCVMGLFLDIDIARTFAQVIAENSEHGTTIGIFGGIASTSTGYAEMLVVVNSEVN